MKNQISHVTRIIGSLFYLALMNCPLNAAPPPLYPDHLKWERGFNHHINQVFFPDSLNNDSTNLYSNGDTVDIYSDGQNKVIVLYADPLLDSLAMYADFIDPAPNILVRLGDDYYSVQNGLFGLNVTNLFLPNFANEEILDDIYDVSPDPWDYLSNLSPKVLRFPSGDGGTFMHPLGSPYTSDVTDADYGKINGGMDTILKI
ncbi:MAG: hypothetical protein R2794_01065 [Chitinophagales bacterium]